MQPIFKALYSAFIYVCSMGLAIGGLAVIFNWGQSYNRDFLMKEAARFGYAEYCLKTNQLEWSGACDSALPSPPAR